MNTLAYTVSQKSWRNFIVQGMARKKIGQIQARISRRRLVRNPTIKYIIINCIPNMTTLACTVSQKSLTKNFIIQSMERKKIGQILYFKTEFLNSFFNEYFNYIFKLIILTLFSSWLVNAIFKLNILTLFSYWLFKHSIFILTIFRILNI